MFVDGSEYRKYIYYCLYLQAKSSRNLKYKDFFDAVDCEPAKADDQSDGDDESQGEGEEEFDDEEDDYDGEEEGDDE